MVGTDRSETAERAVRWAAAFADAYSAELHVVQVVIPLHPADTQHGTAEVTRARAAAEELQSYATNMAGDRGHAHVVIDDDPALAIVHATEEHAIDVLVVGNAGMAGRKEFLLGNVPNRISHNARCTVIIVNTTRDGEVTTVTRPSTTIRSSAVETPTEPHLMSRGTKIATVFAKHGLKELFGRPDADGAVGRRRQAKRLRSSLEELGPTFAKIGQILSTRPDLMPPEFIEELATLQDNVPPLTEEQVVRVMEQELGVPWEDVFETIDPRPLAAGTIAQVHRATLADHTKAVVKVQRPDAKEQIEQDLALLEVFAEKVADRPGLKQVVDMKAVFDHLSESLHRELDFRREAENIERMGSVIEDFSRLRVPVVFADYSTSRLLVMQDIGGGPAASAPEGPARKEAARQLLESFYKQILVDGFFHADPHPGNLMWQPEEETLYFLDLGMAGEVGPDLREHMMLLLMAFWQQDVGFLTDVTLMGHSMGSSVIWSYWQLWGQDRLSKLILVDQMPMITADPRWSPQEKEDAGAIFDPTSLYATISQLAGPDGVKTTEGFIGGMFTKAYSRSEVDWVVKQNLKMPRQYAAALLYNHSTQDWRPVIPRITLPTLVVGGRASVVPWKSQVWIQKHVPDYKTRTLALPHGVYPPDVSWVLHGSAKGTTYNHDAVLMVAGGAAPSPYSRSFDPVHLPRIQAVEREFAYWLTYFDSHPGERFVSDGDPNAVTVPTSRRDQLRDEFRTQRIVVR
jgi:nucleotide-binding universal stress UspA family protein/pimeloyl-ACP methyl ester carboxylesterase